jgi:hypothetical protein
LPPRQRGVPADAAIHGVSKAVPLTPPGPKPAYPQILVPETLSHPHPTVRRIRTELDGQKIHNGALALSARRDTVVRVTPACRNRALILLDALAKAFAERGCELVFGLKHELRSTAYSLAAYVGEQPVKIALYEPTRRIRHVRTKREEASLTHGYYPGVPDYDFPSSGIFRLTIGGPIGAAHRVWSDGKMGKLEARLGEIVVGIEGAAELLAEQKRQYEARRRYEAEHARQRELDQRRAEHQQSLEAELFRMAKAWRDAPAVRAFLRAVEDGTPPEARTETFVAWLAWAKGRAEALDPLSEPARIPKPVEPAAEAAGGGVMGLEPPSVFRQPSASPSEWSHSRQSPRPWRG